MSKKTLVLFRSPDLPEAFTSALSAYFNITCIQVLTFTYDGYEAAFSSLSPNEIEACVFPSQRSVESYHRYLQLNTCEKIFVIGESTRRSCEHLLNRIPDITGTKGAKELSKEIIEKNLCRKLVYFCGDNQNTLPYEEFKAAGIEVEEFECYRTKEVSREEMMDSVRGMEEPEFCVFFSPSGVRCVCGYVPWDWTRIKVLAIGTTTSASLLDTVGKCDGVPEEFNLAGIQTLLLSYTSLNI